MYECERNYFLLPAEREEVQRGIELYRQAKEEARKAFESLGKYGSKRLYLVEGKGWGLCFDLPVEAVVPGLRSPSFEANGSWVSVPDKRKKTGKEINAAIQRAIEANEVYSEILAKSTGVHGFVFRRFPPAFHYSVAFPLKDGRVALATPVVRDGDNDAPKIPNWAIKISKEEFEKAESIAGLPEKSQSLAS